MNERHFGEEGARLSYGSYLHLPELLDQQVLQSDPPAHDELLFITVHQVCELWFKQCLHELDAARDGMLAGLTYEPRKALQRVHSIEQILIEQVVVLETMTPQDFLVFRSLLAPASGFQSMQFREIEFASGLKDEGMVANFSEDEFASTRLRARFDSPSLADEFYAYLRRRGLDAPADDAALSREERQKLYGRRTRAVLEVLTHFEERGEEFLLSEALIAHDEHFQLWRAHHVRMVERMVGTKPGTGGSEGVGYLRTTLDRKFFPELWEARTHLDRAHGSSGCPFAGPQS